jgi:large subunit ribosomal protein LX
MDKYTVTGKWKARDGWQPFEKTVEAENDDVAAEYVYSDFGSKHGLQRTQVEIQEVSA